MFTEVDRGPLYARERRARGGRRRARAHAHGSRRKCSSRAKPASIDVNRRARHKIVFYGKDDPLGHLLGLARPRDCVGGRHLIQPRVRRAVRRPKHRRRDDARAHHVDAARRDLPCDGARHLLDGGADARQCHLAWFRLASWSPAHEHDAARCTEVRHRALDHICVSPQLVKGPLVAIEPHLEKWPEGATAARRSAHNNVKRRLVRAEGAHGGGIENVARSQLQLSRNDGRHLGRVTRRGNDCGTSLLQQARSRQPNPTGPAKHERLFALDQHGVVSS
mmetsp:Transcript_26910/g.89586  ORF Transcript_26910/g.89586 Transcript_26910/m.89586 type:complete len:278 (-) Transcript_26910:58-891(-)